MLRSMDLLPAPQQLGSTGAAEHTVGEDNKHCEQPILRPRSMQLLSIRVLSTRASSSRAFQLGLRVNARTVSAGIASWCARGALSPLRTAPDPSTARGD